MLKMPILTLCQARVVEPIQSSRVSVIVDTLDEVVLNTPRLRKAAVASRAAESSSRPATMGNWLPLRWRDSGTHGGQQATASLLVETGSAGCGLPLCDPLRGSGGRCHAMRRWARIVLGESCCCCCGVDGGKPVRRWVRIVLGESCCCCCGVDGGKPVRRWVRIVWSESSCRSCGVDGSKPLIG